MNEGNKKSQIKKGEIYGNFSIQRQNQEVYPDWWFQ